MKIIDFHTHPGYNSTKHFGYDFDNALFIPEMKRAGISMAAGSFLDMDLLSSGKTYPDIIKQYNEAAWSFSLESEGFFIPGIHIHPLYIKESLDEIIRYRKKGVKLVGELVPYLMGIEEGEVFTSKGFMELFDLCNQLSMTVSLHTTTADECISIAKQFKNVKFVMAHPSYNEEYLSRINAVKQCENLFMDVSGTGIAAYGMLRYAVDTVGREKIVFGTDFPIYNPKMYVDAVLYENLTDAEREYIFYKNASYLLDIK